MISLLSRRDFLRLGTIGLAAPGAIQAARTDRARATACILLYMDGGPSHIDLFDLKPDAPAEIRGPFRPVATSVPGVRVTEHLPLLARQMHRLLQIRSVRHSEGVHDPAVYQMLTGRKHPSSAGGLTVQPDDSPHFACAFGRVDRRPAVMPRIIELPVTMRMEARILPGQGAGFLGPAHDPFRVELTRNAEVVPPPFAPRRDVDRGRLTRRAALLNRLDRRLRTLDRLSGAGSLDTYQRQALALLDRPEVRRAFDLSLEPATLRDRYGRCRHGQSVLLARRLVESGARFVTVYWGKEMQDWADGKGARLVNNPWDTHRNHFPILRDDLLPRADQALAALLADLHDRGLLSSTLVLWMGEFGRTPRIDPRWSSRDHWPGANTVLLAGAGLPGGAVFGRTDRRAAEVTDNPVSPADLTATVFRLLGVDPGAIIRDSRGRPFPLSEGRPIESILGGDR
jgi:hypothetical protein